MTAPAPEQPAAPEPQPVPDDGDDLQAIYQAEIAREPYRFHWADRWWVLPHLGELDYELQAEIEQFGDDMTLEQVKNLFDRIFGAEQAADWKNVVRPIQFLDMLFRRWIAHSGRKPGEPSASAGSSRSTGRPSKRTSTGITASASPRRSTAKKATPRKAATRRGSS